MPHVLRPHQRQALARIKKKTLVALFMEMRLGKTPVIIRWAHGHYPQGRHLVIAPGPTINPDWIDELRNERVRRGHITDLSALAKERRLEAVEGVASGWFLIHYEGLRSQPELIHQPWQTIICDESTRIRNPQAQITKLITRNCGHIPCRALMSGLPRPESDLDYFSQFLLLHNDFMGFENYWVFKNTMFRQDPRLSWLWSPKPGVRDKIKSYVHTHAVVMTKKQAGVGNVHVYERRRVPMNAKQQAAIKELKKKFSFEYIETNFATVRDLWMARVAGGFSPDKENPEVLSDAKPREVLSLMKEELKRKQVVVWFRFNEELQYVVSLLRKNKITADGLYGETPKPEREHLRRFFAAGKTQVLCVQGRLGLYGLNLAAADVAIYYSNWYDLEVRHQSEERIEHLTKKEPLLYIDLITAGSIDEAVVEILRDKRSTARQMMGRLQSFVAQEWKRHHVA